MPKEALGRVIQVRRDAFAKIGSNIKLPIPRSCTQAHKLNNAGLKGGQGVQFLHPAVSGACARLVANSRWTCDPATNSRTAGAPTPREHLPGQATPSLDWCLLWWSAAQRVCAAWIRASAPTRLSSAYCRRRQGIACHRWVCTARRHSRVKGLAQRRPGPGQTQVGEATSENAWSPGHPHPCTVEVDGAALRVAELRKHCTYPELARGGPQKLLVLGSEIGGRWNTAAQGFVRDLVRLRALRAPPAVRAAAFSGWARRWWGALSVAVQLAVASTALGCAWPAAPLPGPSDGPALDRVLDLAADAGPSRLPLRP